MLFISDSAWIPMTKVQAFQSPGCLKSHFVLIDLMDSSGYLFLTCEMVFDYA